ncbi:unnamed protein product [Eretmochelys imbricata]
MGSDPWSIQSWLLSPTVPSCRHCRGRSKNPLIHSFGRASQALFRLARHPQTRQLCSCWKILLTGDEAGGSENPRCHGELAENAHWICDLSCMGWQREWMWDTAILRSLSLSWFHCVQLPSRPPPLQFIWQRILTFTQQKLAQLHGVLQTHGIQQEALSQGAECHVAGSYSGLAAHVGLVFLGICCCQDFAVPGPWDSRVAIGPHVNAGAALTSGSSVADPLAGVFRG